MKNYEDYKCTDCGVTGLKLWRDYGYCSELWCAMCCKVKIAKAEEARKSDPWDEPPGPLDMMRYGFSGVAAIPTDADCDAYQSSGAFKADGLLWWHALPTFADEHSEIQTVMHTIRRSREDLAREEEANHEQTKKVNSLRVRVGKLPIAVPDIKSDGGWGYRHELSDARRVMLETLKTLYTTQNRRLELYNEQADLEWLLERDVVELIQPTKVRIWGTETKTVPMENGKLLRISGGVEQSMDLEPGQRIAVSKRGLAVVLLGETFRECPTIMDHNQNGRMLLDELFENDKVIAVRGY